MLSLRSILSCQSWKPSRDKMLRKLSMTDQSSKYYRFKYTINTDTSAGLTPLMRLACPSVSG
jgi:hypothetical protein